MKPLNGLDVISDSTTPGVILHIYMCIYISTFIIYRLFDRYIKQDTTVKFAFKWFNGTVEILQTITGRLQFCCTDFNPSRILINLAE
jgi:hypothetical protein